MSKRLKRNLRTPSITSGEDCVTLNNVEQNNNIAQYRTDDDEYSSKSAFLVLIDWNEEYAAWHRNGNRTFRKGPAILLC